MNRTEQRLNPAGKRPRAGAPAEDPGGLTLFAEVLRLGLLVAIAALPLVTALAAIAAGSTLLRSFLADGTVPTVGRFTRSFALAARDAVCLLAPVVLGLFAALDTLALVAGLPGGWIVGPAIALVLTVLAGACLRAAGQWRPGTRWRDAVRTGATATVGDPVGGIMLAAAIWVFVLLGARAPLLLPVLPGLLVLAVVAVDRRRQGDAVP